MKTGVKKVTGNQRPTEKNVLVVTMPKIQEAPAATVEEMPEEKPADQPKAEEVKPIETQVKEILHGLKPFTAEERIANAENFKILTARFEFLKKKDGELKRFNLQNSGTNAKLILKNQEGENFEVTNSNVIMKALAVMSEELNLLLTETEAEVLNFQI
jgi:hypothetical protein